MLALPWCDSILGGLIRKEIEEINPHICADRPAWSVGMRSKTNPTRGDAEKTNGVRLYESNFRFNRSISSPFAISINICDFLKSVIVILMSPFWEIGITSDPPPSLCS